MVATKTRSYDPEYIVYKGNRTQINTDFRVALRCIALLNDSNVSDFERTYGVIFMLFGILPDTPEEVNFLTQKAKLYLQCGETQEEHESRKKDMDFQYDYPFIEASFQSDYGIDLSNVSMSWWRFMRLLNGFTENSIMSRVREIRNYDLSTIKDSKFKSQMQNAKKRLRLPEENEAYTDEELEAIEKFNKL